MLKYKKNIVLGVCFVIVLIIIINIMLPFFNSHLSSMMSEGFSKYNTILNTGKYPSITKELLVQDTFPTTPDKSITTNDYSDVWTDYPVFKLGSFAQITNNLKHMRSPDIGTCIPAGMCGALYERRDNKSNYAVVLPSVVNDGRVRVNYYNYK